MKIMVYSKFYFLMFLFVLFLGIASNTYAAETNWYDAEWNYAVELKIPSGVVEEDLNNFPVYTDLSNLPNDFFDSVQSDCSDIRVTSSDKVTELPFEVVSCDTDTKTGELYFLAQVINYSTDTTFYIFFGNENALNYLPGDSYGSEAVWSDYDAVLHFEDGVSDSTSGNNDGVAYDIEYTKDGLGKAGIFNGVSSYVILPSGLLDSKGLVSVHSKLSQIETDSIIVNSTKINLSDYLRITSRSQFDGGVMSFIVNNDSLFSTKKLNTEWSYTSINWNSQGKARTQYDDEYIESNTNADPSNSHSIFIGVASDENEVLYYNPLWMDGMVSEFRLRKEDVTEAWTEAERKNISTPEVFYVTSIVTKDIVVEEDDIDTLVIALKNSSKDITKKSIKRKYLLFTKIIKKLIHKDQDKATRAVVRQFVRAVDRDYSKDRISEDEKSQMQNILNQILQKI